MELNPTNSKKDLTTSDLKDMPSRVQAPINLSTLLQNRLSKAKLVKSQEQTQKSKNPQDQITACILDSNETDLKALEQALKKLSSSIKLVTPEVILEQCENENSSLDLIFSKSEFIADLDPIIDGENAPMVISLSHKATDAIVALQKNLDGFILFPLNLKDTALSIYNILDKITKRRSQSKTQDALRLPHNRLIGVPTIEGIEFISIDQIVRCEGLQKCTLLITTEKQDIISSYSIGKFRELLDGKGFFACHRSHHINLKFVKKYTREGFIFFNANCKPVPLARRRKLDFLDQIAHL
ncbi:MAG: LytR/AlgR family response regulator transcription factor [Flavobacteriaceae bacterium]